MNIKKNNGDTALIGAVLSKNIDVVKLIIDAKVDINAKNNKGITAMMLAKKNSYLHPEIVELLEKVNAE